LEPALPIRPIENSIGLKLALLPAGDFLMGSPEPEGEPDEQPRRRVRLTRAFFIGVCPVTQAEYQAVTGANPSRFRPGATGGAQHPVERISWDEAVEFCAKLSGLPEERRAGRRYRLPTEAEWEYACRAGSEAAFAFGNVLTEKQANIGGRLGRTSPVGAYRPNAFGLHDMHGNVWEWCADWYSESAYRYGPMTDPPGPSSGSDRVVRGGCWAVGPFFCGSACRRPPSPPVRSEVIGFRVVCSAD
jgi:formylglycine-generating enzyme required for sulfatase activity